MEVSRRLTPMGKYVKGRQVPPIVIDGGSEKHYEFKLFHIFAIVS